MIPRSLVLLCALAAVGCGSGLDDLKNPTLTAQTAGVPLFLRVGWANSGCPSVSDVTATLNGVALAVDSLGGPAGGILGGCKAIQFSGATPAALDATFVLTDGDITWTMKVPGYFGPRGLTITAPGTTLHPGDEVTTSTVPETDSFDPGPGASAQFLSDDGKTAFVLKEGVSVSGAEIRFTVPAVSAIPIGGAPGTLSVSGGIPLAQVAMCDGPVACKAVLATDYATKATLLP